MSRSMSLKATAVVLAMVGGGVPPPCRALRPPKKGAGAGRAIHSGRDRWRGGRRHGVCRPGHLPGEPAHRQGRHHPRGRGTGDNGPRTASPPVPVCLVLFFPPVDYENNGLNGICVANVDPEGNILGVVNDVRVTGFTVQGFPGVGIVFAGTNRPRADHNVAANNRGYGITAFVSTHGRFEDNTSYGSGDAGFYVGNSPNADFTVQNNTAFADLWGILVRDSATGSVTGNIAARQLLGAGLPEHGHEHRRAQLAGPPTTSPLTTTTFARRM